MTKIEKKIKLMSDDDLLTLHEYAKSRVLKTNDLKDMLIECHCYGELKERGIVK